MRLLFICIIAISGSLLAAQDFFAPAVKSGTVGVKLFPTENVVAGNSYLVTFGVPFPRGSLSLTNMTTIRVLKGNTEIPAYVEMLTPWRHFTDKSIDDQWVRIARIQINYTFTSTYGNSESITVEWGQTARIQNLTAFIDPRTAWHLVTTGSFTTEDSVWEPDVYAVLPKTLLCEGILRPMRMEPFIDSIKETRDDPYEMSIRQHWPEYEEQMYATKNFFYSIINEDDPLVAPENRCDYKTTEGYECWLFERPATMFNFYFRSGFLKPLREAVRCAEFYRRHIKPDGFFDIKPEDDSKYVYSEGLAYTYWLTGDPEMQPMFNKILQAHDETNMRWSPDQNFWTERHSGFKLLAYQIAYEVLGDETLKDAVWEYTNDLIWLQDGAGGIHDSILIASGFQPSSRADGGLWHLGSQHDWDWDPEYLGASPWMSMFVIDPMIRVYQCCENEDVANFIKRMGKFLAGACALTSYNSSDGLQMLYPRYTVLWNQETGDSDEWSDNQHAMEVCAGIAYGYYFSLLLNSPDTSLRTRGNDAYYTADECISDFTRPDAPYSGYTAFRVSPYRQHNWQYHCSGALGWALKQTGILEEKEDTKNLFPVEFRLYQNYPNPFNPRTVISYKLAVKSEVELKIYDILGREITVLVNEVKNAGDYTVGWNGTNSAGRQIGSGVYFYQLKTNTGFVTAKKMILVK
jgi:hypothetical protein